MTREINGWLFPDGVEVPEGSWYRISFGDREVWDMDKHGHMEVARQVGLTDVKTSVDESGSDHGGDVRYAAVTAKVIVDGDIYQAVGGADTMSDQVRSPEHVWSVAETRGLKRAIKRAVGIRPAGEADTESDYDEFGHPTEDPQPATETPDPPAEDDDIDW